MKGVRGRMEGSGILVVEAEVGASHSLITRSALHRPGPMMHSLQTS